MTAMTRAEKERQNAARSRAGRIRYGMSIVADAYEAMVEARAQGDHLTLGYETWEAYVDGEFGEHRIKLDPDKRAVAVAAFAAVGLTQRETAYTIGVSPATVNRALAAGVSDETRSEGEGAGQPVVDALKQALRDADERNETAGLAGPAPDAEQASVASGTAPEGGLTHPPSGAPTDAPDAVNGAGPSEAAGDVQPPPAAPQDHPGTSNPGEGAVSATAPAAGGEATTPPPAAQDAPFVVQRPDGDAGSPPGSGEPAPSPLDAVLGAIDAIAAETGVCPACRRPLGATS